MNKMERIILGGLIKFSKTDNFFLCKNISCLDRNNHRLNGLMKQILGVFSVGNRGSGCGGLWVDAWAALELEMLSAVLGGCLTMVSSLL